MILVNKKILFVVNVDWFFVSHRLPIGLELIKLGYEVHLACNFTSHFDFLFEQGFNLHQIDFTRAGTNFFLEFRIMYELNSLIKRVHPDLIHCVTIKPVLYGALVTRFKDVKRVFSISGLGFIFISQGFISKLRQKLIFLLYRIGFSKNNTTVIFQNVDDKCLFVSNSLINENQSQIIRGSGVDLNFYNPTKEPEGSKVVMFLARLLFDKGISEFVEAAKILRTKQVSARFVVVGDFDHNPRSVSKDQIDAWVGQGIIEYWGHSDDVSLTYSKCHLVVLPSYREGLPKSLIEAAACARAVITTDVPGCRDAIESNKTGLLVPVKDPVSLSNAIEKLIIDDDLRVKFSLAGRNLAEKSFSIEEVVKNHIEIYSSLFKGT